MIRLIIEVVLGVLLAIAATLAFVKFSETRDLQVQLTNTRETLAGIKEKLTLAEEELEKIHSKEAHAGDHKPHWGYEGEMNPAKWGEAFPMCGAGQAQSPVDIRGPFGKATQVLKTDYKTGPLKILNNGHTIQVNIAPGSKMWVNSEQFELLQFHFHKPSEELIDGKPAAMVAHFVHKSESGKLAVIGVLLKETGENRFLKSIWQNAPKVEGPEVEVAGTTINPTNLLPTTLKFWTYEGSLTTPPCTEGVSFFILKNPAHISRDQLEAFPFKMNARPVQPLNGRKILSD